MRITHLVTSTAVIATLAFAAPAFAQHRDGGRSAGSSTRESGRSAPRSAPAQAPRSVAPSRSAGPSRNVAPSRSFEQSRSRGPVVVGRAAPRTSFSYSHGAPRYVAPRNYGYNRSYGYGYTPYRFSRPYYSFRPRLNLGFGLWAGYPVVYPYYASPYAYDPSYYDDYAYTAPGYSSAVPYGMPAPGTVTAQSGRASAGVSFEITPANAEVFIDGRDYGVASNFTADFEPLAIAPGRHHVELRAPGYETMAFDSDVVAGQVIPYQGTLRPLR